MRIILIFFILTILIGCIQTESRPVFDEEVEADLTICKNISDLAESHLCIRDLAIEEQNIQICDKIINTEKHFTNVKDLCYIDFAETNKNASICNDVGMEKSLCYAKVALAVNNLSLCENVNQSNTRDACYSEVGIEVGSASACGKITEEQLLRDWCYLQVAMKNNDSSLCNQIQESYYVDWCVDATN
jgi:hypothetical protein